MTGHLFRRRGDPYLVSRSRRLLDGDMTLDDFADLLFDYGYGHSSEDTDPLVAMALRSLEPEALTEAARQIVQRG